MGAISLGIDIGTTSAKCLAVDERGEILALAQHPYPMSHPRQGWAEQDPEDYWQGLVEVVASCVQACRQQGHVVDEIVAMAMSTQGDTLILADAAGRAVGPALSWMDVRPEQEFHELLAEADQSFWYRECGIRLVPGSSACKVRWVRRHQPDRWAQVRRVCAVPDYLAFRLTGQFVTDAPSASWGPCFSPQRRDWSATAIEVVGLPVDYLPAAVESGTVIGALLPDVARRLGLAPGTMLVAGAFDQAAAGLGAGARAGEKSVLSCGTAWVLYAVSGSPAFDLREQTPVCCHANAGEWGMVLPFAGGAVYDWGRRNFHHDGEQATRRDTDPLVFIPHFYGSGSPDWRAESRGTLLGLTMAHGWPEIELALMRGIASEAKRNIEVVDELSGRVQSINMVGGASRNRVWPQIIADLLGCPVEIAQNVESACYGAAKLAAGTAAASWFPVAAERIFHPTAEGAATEGILFRRYLQALAAVLPYYAASGTSC